MANQLFAGFVLTDAGVAISGATVDLLARNTTTPVLATTTTDANGYFAISHATEGRFDVRITNGSSVRWRKYDTSQQMTALEVQTLRVRNPAFTFDYDVVPAAIAADRQLNLPLITGTDTLASLGLAQTFTAIQTHSANLIANALVLVGDTTNADMTVGLTLNQGAADDQIFALKSSDVAHGITTITETDTYAFAKKQSPTAGGLLLAGVGETTNGLTLDGYIVTENATRSIGALAPVLIRGAVKSGTDLADLAADKNLVVFQNGVDAAQAVVIIDTDGDIHVDGAATLTVYDDYDDIALLTTYRNMTRRFGEIVAENRDALIKHKIVSEGGFVSYKGLTALIIDGLRQTNERLSARIALIEQRLPVLPEAK